MSTKPVPIVLKQKLQCDACGKLDRRVIRKPEGRRPKKARYLVDWFAKSIGWSFRCDYRMGKSRRRYRKGMYYCHFCPACTREGKPALGIDILKSLQAAS